MHPDVAHKIDLPFAGAHPTLLLPTVKHAYKTEKPKPDPSCYAPQWKLEDCGEEHFNGVDARPKSRHVELSYSGWPGGG
jgi:hypothetical protein